MKDTGIVDVGNHGKKRVRRRSWTTRAQDRKRNVHRSRKTRFGFAARTAHAIPTFDARAVRRKPRRKPIRDPCESPRTHRNMRC